MTTSGLLVDEADRLVIILKFCTIFRGNNFDLLGVNSDLAFMKLNEISCLQ